MDKRSYFVIVYLVRFEELDGALKKKMEPLVEWLQEDDSGSEEDEDDSD